MIREVYDYVVIGSGPGGAPLAVRLAEAGHRVLVLEAGGLSSRGDGQPDLVHDVPAYHSAASEDPGMRWDYFVKNYSDRRLRRANSKDHQGRTYYPRSATLGGCSAHNALISIYPFDRDWDAIAELTGNTQWSASNLRRIFEEKLVASSGSQGWLPIQRPDLKLLKEDPVLAAITVNAAVETFLTDLAQSADTDRLSDLSELVLNNLSADLLGNLPEFVGGTKKDLLKQQLLSHFDPNARGALAAGREGLFTLPLCTQNGVRYSTRTLLQAARQRLPNLVIHPGSLAQRIVLADDKPRRAIAVEYLQAGQDQGVIAGDRTGRPVGQGAKRRIAFAKFEIVVAAGAFESPHLLMLSGIGPREQLERCEIDPLVDLPGVGENLQDRAEVAVVSRLKQPLTTLQGATLLPESAASDPAFAKWQASQKQGGPDHGHAAGIYATNGGTVARALRSAAARKHGEHDPDLILFGLAADFRGYELDYSRKLVTDPAEHRTLTWAILKARTANRGTVQLDRNHPEGPPEINFRY